MSMSVSFTDNTDTIIELINSKVKEALGEMGIKAVAEVKANAPVDNGILRRSYTYVTEDFSVIIGTDIDYSIHVEFKPSNKGGRPHFRNSLESLQSEFQNILNRKLGEI
ncbi:hypothetical protein TPDSL_17990 [Terrisporobacter petrolearius]|uniref:HK97 gp10 family phage protein n=1 Tax=Terrisporobacter petrolearius TaxID=1460447 RepID=UPI00336994E8